MGHLEHDRHGLACIPVWPWKLGRHSVWFAPGTKTGYRPITATPPWTSVSGPTNVRALFLIVWIASSIRSGSFNRLCPIAASFPGWGWKHCGQIIHVKTGASSSTYQSRDESSAQSRKGQVEDWWCLGKSPERCLRSSRSSMCCHFIKKKLKKCRHRYIHNQKE